MYAMMQMENIEDLLAFFRAYPDGEKYIPKTAMMAETTAKTSNMPNPNRKIAFELITDHPQTRIVLRIAVVVKLEDKFIAVDQLKRMGITILNGWSLIRVSKA